ILGAKFGPSVPCRGRSAPRHEPAVPWNGQPLRGAGGLLRGIDGALRGGEDALRGTGGPLRRGEPCSSERLARFSEREPRERGGWAAPPRALCRAADDLGRSARPWQRKTA